MQSKRKLNRAKLFIAYDALKGFKEMIHEKEKTVIRIERKTLSEDQLFELNWKIQSIEEGSIISLIYYVQNEYILKTGYVAKNDLEKRTIQVVDQIIKYENIYKIYCQIFCSNRPRLLENKTIIYNGVRTEYKGGSI